MCGIARRTVRAMAEIAELVEQLERERTARLHEVEVLGTAIAQLQSITVTVPAAARRSSGASVRALTLHLMEEADRDWTTNEVVAEYEHRGVTLNSQHPANAVRSSLADLLAHERIERTGPGRYRATKFTARPLSLEGVRLT